MRSRGLLGMFLAVSVAGCTTADDDGGVEDDGEVPLECPSGQSDGGDGVCVADGTCSLGYRRNFMAESSPCIPIVPGTVRYEGPRGPVAGVTVLFHDESGALIDRGQTDEAGETPSLLPLVDRPGLVTVVVPDEDLSDPAAPTLVSLETRPWELDLVKGPLFAPGSTSLSVALPGTVEGAASYVVDAGFVEVTVTDPSQPVILTPPPARPGWPADVLATAFDEAGTPLAWSLGYGSEADITLERWRDDFVDIAVEVTNNPENTTGFAYPALVTVGREYGLGQRMELPAPTEPAPPAPEPLRVRVPDTGLELLLVTGYVHGPSMRGLHVTPELTVDLAAEVIAPLERAPTVLDSGSARPRIEWDESDQTRLPHRTRVTLRYNGGARAERWVLPEQRDATGVTVPELPDDLADRAPVDLDGAEVDLDLIAGEDADLFSLYAGGHAAPAPGRRSRFTPPISPYVWISSSTFPLSKAPPETR